MSPVVFYVLLVLLSDEVEFSFLWFIVALVFGGGEQAVRYRYTTDRSLEGKEVSD